MDEWSKLKISLAIVETGKHSRGLPFASKKKKKEKQYKRLIMSFDKFSMGLQMQPSLSIIPILKFSTCIMRLYEKTFEHFSFTI